METNGEEEVSCRTYFKTKQLVFQMSHSANLLDLLGAMTSQIRTRVELSSFPIRLSPTNVATLHQDVTFIGTEERGDVTYWVGDSTPKTSCYELWELQGHVRRGSSHTAPMHCFEQCCRYEEVRKSENYAKVSFNIQLL